MIGQLLSRLTTLVVAFGLVAANVATAADKRNDPIKVRSAEAIKGTNQVVIGAFNVGFIFQSVDRAKASGGLMGAFGGATRTKSQLTGVTPQMIQAITDAAHADFVRQLGAAGFSVVDSAAMFASPQFAKVKYAPAPYEASIALEKGSKGKAEYFKPSALPGLVMLPGDFTSSGLSGLGMTMQSAQTAMAMTQYAKANNVAVIDVVYLIDFSNTKRPGAFSFGGLKVSGGMSVVSDFSKVSVISPSGKTASLTLDESVAVEGDFATMADATKDGGLQKAANIAGGVAAVFGMGGLMFGKSKTFAFTAIPGVYEQGVTKAAALANERVVGRMAALR
jgi:hypothetical protein